jgi:hypothetical protein
VAANVPRSAPAAQPAAADSASDTPSRPKWPPLTQMAVYLKAVRLVLDEAIETRHSLVRQLGVLLDEARTAHRTTIVQAVGRVGGDLRHDFDTLRRRLEHLEVPPPCVRCHDAVVQWLDEMVAACAGMVAVGDAHDLTRLHETQEHLATSRAGARVFNQEYERLLGELKRRATATARRRSRLSRLRGLLPGARQPAT